MARTGRFSRAAREIGVSQPTLSARVQAFEAATPMRLFLRDGHVVRVAPEAEGLMAKIRITLSCFDEVERDLTGRQARAARRLSIGFSAHRLIMPILSSFVRGHTDIGVETRGGPSAVLLRVARPARRGSARPSCPISPSPATRASPICAEALGAREAGEARAAGVHLIAVQSADGSLVVGDSHVYGDRPQPFASDRFDELILAELGRVPDCPAAASRSSEPAPRPRPATARC